MHALTYAEICIIITNDEMIASSFFVILAFDFARTYVSS